jgi:hypothetical protein
MRTLDRFSTDKEDVRKMSEAELAKLGIRLQDKQSFVLECTNCGETWSPQLDSNGKLPFEFWVCPSNCNR